MRARKFDFSGTKTGDFTVVEFSHMSYYGMSLWRCVCRCGEEKFMTSTAIRNGKNTCKCANGHENLKGKKFGRLTAIELVKKNGKAYWKCKCDCGGESISRSDELKNGDAKSCGCLQKEAVSKSSTKHGMSNTKTYNIWKGITQRCVNKNSTGYKNYGGRGISISDDWRKFDCFYKDMGEVPKGRYEIDRIDNDKGYCKENCRWILKEYNNYNSRGRKNSTSIYKGVSLDKQRNKWVSRIVYKGEKVFFKRFDSEIEAAKAYNENVVKYFGEYAYLNKV